MMRSVSGKGTSLLLQSKLDLLRRTIAAGPIGVFPSATVMC